MTKSRLASFLDSCLLACSIVFISLLTLAKLKIGIIFRLILSAIFGSIAFILYAKREKKRYKNQQLKIKDQHIFTLITLKLQLMSTSEKQEYFSSLFEKLKSTLPNTSQNISFNIYSLTNNTTSISNSLLQNIIDNTKNKSFDNYYIILLSHDIQTELITKYAQIEKKNITLLYPEDLYSLIKKLEVFPDITGLEKAKEPLKIRLKTIFSNLMYKRNAKAFFFSALLLLFSSLFVPYKTYYHSIAIILLSISAICLIFGKKPVKT